VHPKNVKGIKESLIPLTFFFVDTCPHEYLKHLLLHPRAQVIECASGEAEETLS
jgi:hypothetical protein